MCAMLHDRSQCPVMRLLVDRTRRAAVAGPALAQAHREVGAALAPFAGSRCSLYSVPIEHVAGPSQGVELEPRLAPIVLVLMRAGLFVAEGLWSSIPGAALVPWDGDPAALSEAPIEGRPVIVVDSVINTGRSIHRTLELLVERRPAWVTVAALVANSDGLASCCGRWPEVDFAIARVSSRSYVGRGGTDTGARLFGTTSWARRCGARGREPATRSDR